VKSNVDPVPTPRTSAGTRAILQAAQPNRQIDVVAHAHAQLRAHGHTDQRSGRLCGFAFLAERIHADAAARFTFRIPTRGLQLEA
jgi:hypothetical protein